MKKFISIFIVLATLLATSCDEKNSESSMVIDRYTLSFEATANSNEQLTVTALNVDWEVKVASSASHWLSAVKGDGGTITVSVKDNNSTQERAGVIKVVSSSGEIEPKIITVLQKGNPSPTVYEIVLDPSSLSFGPLDSVPAEVGVSCEVADFTWTATIGEGGEWFSIEPGTDKITVSVKDNDEERIRVGTIFVTSDNPDVEPARMVVEQKPVKKLSVSQTELYYEAYNYAIGGTVTVKAVDVAWGMELTDEDGRNVSWIKATVYSSMIEIKVQINYSVSPRVAYLRVFPTNTDEVDEVVVPIYQAGQGE